MLTRRKALAFEWGNGKTLCGDCMLFLALTAESIYNKKKNLCGKNATWRIHILSCEDTRKRSFYE